MKLKSILLVAIALCVMSPSVFSQNVAGKVLDVKSTTPVAKSDNLVQVKKPAMDFTVEVDGKDVKFSELTKGKIVFLNFWGTWCGPCRREIPAIIEIQKEMKGEVIVIGIASERSANDKPKVEDFVKKNGINYLNVMRNKDLEQYYGMLAYNVGSIKYVPTTFLINKDGYVVDFKNGAHSKEDFVKWIKTATK